jgi:hypothetical protein
MAIATSLSLEEYLALPQKEGVSFEYDEGRVIEVPAHSLENAELQMTVGELLRAASDPWALTSSWPDPPASGSHRGSSESLTPA